jgi:hypothetical protein
MIAVARHGNRAVLALAVLGAVVTMRDDTARAGAWSLEPLPMPQPRRVELAFGVDLRRLAPAAVPATGDAPDANRQATGGKMDPGPHPGEVVAMFLQSTAEATRGVYLGVNLELGSTGVTDSSSTRLDDEVIYWGAGAVISAIPTRGVVVFRAELVAAVRGFAMPAPRSRDGRRVTPTHLAVEPRIAIEVTLNERWSVGLHAGAELLPHRAPLLGIYVLHRGRAASSDLLGAPLGAGY